MLLAGKSVAGLVDYDDRRVQQHYIAGLAEPRDVVMLGSSRAMQICAAQFPGRSFFNHSVTGAVLDDYAMIVHHYAARRMMPRHVLLVLDPWLLSAHATRPVDARVPLTARLRAAVSPSYCQAALRSFKAYGGRPWPRDPLPDESGGLTLADGSRVHPKSIRERNAMQVRADAVRTAATFDSRLRDFRELDEMRDTHGKHASRRSSANVDTSASVPYNDREYHTAGCLMPIREISQDSVVVASTDQISADLADEVAILNFKSGVYYGLDPVGARIWQLIREPQTVAAIHSTLITEYDVDPIGCATDLIAFLAELETEGLIDLGR